MVNRTEPRIGRTFAALADPARRAIVARLAHGPATVGELRAPLRISAPAVSKHLRVLEQAGLMSRRIEGRVHWCRFEPRAMDEALAWIHGQRRMWDGMLDSLAAHLGKNAAQEGKCDDNSG